MSPPEFRGRESCACRRGSRRKCPLHFSPQNRSRRSPLGVEQPAAARRPVFFPSHAFFSQFVFFAHLAPSTTTTATATTPPPPPQKRFFETFSYLPPLSDAEIAKQVDYVTRNGWVPALEFADPSQAYVADTNTVRIRNSVGYQDNRYWSMYKLPMFGCTDSSQVLKEIASATKSFPNAYIRLVAFNPDRQVQVAGMLVHRPTTVRKEEKRRA